MTLVLVIGIGAGSLLLAGLVWSIRCPDLRLWPPKRSTLLQKLLVWALTLLIFGSALYLGIAEWNSLGWPVALRWAVGLPMIIMGNVVVWMGLAQIGLAATSGEATGLRTQGLYRYSRNPQYVADVFILCGWLVLSASAMALPVVVLGILVLVIAPLAEEPWLAENYGQQYDAYRSNVPRYI